MTKTLRTIKGTFDNGTYILLGLSEIEFILIALSIRYIFLKLILTSKQHKISYASQICAFRRFFLAFSKSKI